ncbi:MAG: aminopeptidase P family protein [Dehalococcoidia bacterium]|nr:aminopeptidase P family protein [Dehalococcoidia bacterium]
MSHRLNKLREKLEEKGLDAILISQGENRRYLSGFTGSAGFLLISEKSTILATDFRYAEQAKSQAPDFVVVQIEGELPRWFPNLISTLRVKKIGFESSDLSFSTYRKLVAIMGEKSEKELVPTEEFVESLRAVKDEEELELIIRAVEISDTVFEEVAPRIHPGMTEKELAWEIEKLLREKGSESVPFDIIVASGPNSALPHHKPTDRAILSAEPVVIDMGARFKGYSSDLSRTICLGNQDEKFGKIYDLVLSALLTAIATIEAGMAGVQADSLARKVIEQGGCGENFGHGLGHGIGLAAHEQPRLGRGSEDVLAEGMVFTIEPGIYIKGWGGVRIEDVVVLEKGKVKLLSKARKVD